MCIDGSIYIANYIYPSLWVSPHFSPTPLIPIQYHGRPRGNSLAGFKPRILPSIHHTLKVGGSTPVLLAFLALKSTVSKAGVKPPHQGVQEILHHMPVSQGKWILACDQCSDKDPVLC